MENGHTLSFRFPEMMKQNSNASASMAQSFNNNKTKDYGQKKVIFPSLSQELPARIQRKSTRVHHEKTTKIPFDQPLVLRINEKNDEIEMNRDESMAPCDSKQNVLLRTVTHSEKYCRRKQNTKRSSLPNKTYPKTIPTKLVTEKLRFGNEELYDFINNQPRINDSFQQHLQTFELKRMSSTEKVRKWLNNHYIEHAAKDSKDQDVTKGSSAKSKMEVNNNEAEESQVT
uniref:Uncharacterized protein n=1 Tax=Clytia hemisphaerica TaxID=252671 RepID=A0A7M5WIG7_9CNID